MQRLYFLFIIVFFVIAVLLGESKASKIRQLKIPTKITSPTPASPQNANSNIVVLSPKNNQKVENPFLIRGKAKVFENVVSIKLMDDKGNVLTETVSYATSPDVGEFGDFEAYVGYSTRQTKGVLEVYQVSAKDGSQADLIKIPLNFK